MDLRVRSLQTHAISVRSSVKATTYPLGTVREDNFQMAGSDVRRLASWTFGDGRTAGRVVSDSSQRPEGIVPVDDWGDTNNPRVLVAAVGFIAGARAAALADQALQQM